MSPVAPSTAELMRRIDDIVARLDRITDNLERSYVRLDVYNAERSADGIQVTELESEVHRLGQRIDGLTEQRDRERDSLITRMRSNNRFVASALVMGIFSPFLALWLAHAAGIK